MNNVKYLILLLLTAYTTKVLILGALFADGPILICLAGLFAAIEYKLQDKKLVVIEQKNQDIETELSEVKGHLTNIQNELSMLKSNRGIKSLHGRGA